jgi:ubiquinone/menaquinone biosynthesis C-methylase UbiE
MPLSTTQLAPSQAYWNAAAETYERDFTATLIGRLWRDAVWQELDRGFHSGDRLLELNCGTGIDAVHLAARNIRVLACDISPRMVELARQRASATPFFSRLDFRVVPTEQIHLLEREGPFDGAFSNFSGLNCVEDVSAIRDKLARLVKPGARVFLCMLGRYAAWEILWSLAHGNFHKAAQRFRPTPADSTNPVKVQYLSRTQLAALFAPTFTLRSWKGIGITVPPAYMERWARHAPGLINALARVDRALSKLSPFRSFANCILLEFQRTGPPAAK